MSGLGNPVALQANFTVDPLRTVKLLPGCREEITGGTVTKKEYNFQLKADMAMGYRVILPFEYLEEVFSPF